MTGPYHFRAAEQLLEADASMLDARRVLPRGSLTRFARATSRLTVSGCGSGVGAAIRRQLRLDAVRRRDRSLI
jgi:hypothetical protein